MTTAHGWRLRYNRRRATTCPTRAVRGGDQPGLGGRRVRIHSTLLGNEPLSRPSMLIRAWPKARGQHLLQWIRHCTQTGLESRTDLFARLRISFIASRMCAAVISPCTRTWLSCLHQRRQRWPSSLLPTRYHQAVGEYQTTSGRRTTLNRRVLGAGRRCRVYVTKHAQPHLKS